MKLFAILTVAALAVLLVSCGKPSTTRPDARVFQTRGVIQELKPDGLTVVIQHEAISNYMDAMTMPFKAKSTAELSGLQPGDQISFRLWVTTEESWIDQMKKTGATFPIKPKDTPATPTNNLVSFKLSDIPEFALTNEFGQAVNLHQYIGKAVALTFFFTRCPLPDYCPRLSKNFEGASAKLKAMPQGPTNYQFISISFDPLDKPEILQAYAQRFAYDPEHWSFLTGKPEHIQELTHGFGITLTKDGFFYDHNFVTVVFDTSGRLQTLWRFGGDTTDILVNEILKATSTTNTLTAQN